MVTIDKVMSVVNETMFADLGIQAFELFNFCMNDLKNWCRLGSFNISPRMCGPLAPMFASITVVVDVGCDLVNKKIVLRYEYTYTHHDGGRNGHTVMKKLELS